MWLSPQNIIAFLPYAYVIPEGGRERTVGPYLCLCYFIVSVTLFVTIYSRKN